MVAGLTSSQGRSILGTGGSLNTHHEGPTKSPTEERALNNIERGRSKAKKGEAPMLNEGFLHGPPNTAYYSGL